MYNHMRTVYFWALRLKLYTADNNNVEMIIMASAELVPATIGLAVGIV